MIMKKIISLLVLLFAVSAPALSQYSDEAGVARAVDSLSKALVAADKAQLEKLTAPELSYGHSGGRVESQVQFVDALVSKKSSFSAIDMSKVTTSMVGDLAIVRGHMSAIVTSTGTPVKTELEILMVWQKRSGEWKLLARQAYKV
jgi:hypothetical protein